LDTIENDIRAVGVCIGDVENREKWKFKTKLGGQPKIVGTVGRKAKEKAKKKNL